MRNGLGLVFSSAPIAKPTAVVPEKIIPVQPKNVEPVTLSQREEMPASPVVQSPVKIEPTPPGVPVDVPIPSSVPEIFHPLAKVNMDFLKGITIDVTPAALSAQINNVVEFTQGVDVLFQNLQYILSFSPFVNIQTNFQDNIKFITTAQNTDYTYVLSPMKLIDHILLSNRIGTHLQNEGKTNFTEAEVVQLCTTMWAPVNVLAGDCLSTIHNVTAFYTREALNMKNLNLDNLLNAASGLTKRSTSEMSASLNEIMATYAALLNYEKLLQQSYSNFIGELKGTSKTVKMEAAKMVEILPSKKPSFMKTLLIEKILPYAKTTGETLVSDLTERILDLEDMHSVSGTTVLAWSLELLATEANNLVTQSDTFIVDKTTSYLMSFIDAAGLDKFTNNFAKQAIKKTVPNMHKRVKTKLTNIITSSRAKSAPKAAVVVDIGAIASLMTLKCAALDFSKCLLVPSQINNVLADGITCAVLTVNLKDDNNNPLSGQVIHLKGKDSLTVNITPQSGTSVDDGTVVFNVVNTVPETVTITAFSDTTEIGTATINFISVPITASTPITGSFFNNVLTLNLAANTLLSLSYPFVISSNKSSIITESKTTDENGYVTFYSIPQNVEFTINLKGLQYSGSTNSSNISAIADTISVIEPIAESSEPEPIAESTVVESSEVEPIAESTVVESSEPEPVAESSEVESSEPEPIAESTIVESSEPEPVAESTVVESSEPEPIAESTVVESSEPEPVAESTVVESSEVEPEPVAESSAVETEP